MNCRVSNPQHVGSQTRNLGIWQGFVEKDENGSNLSFACFVVAPHEWRFWKVPMEAVILFACSRLTPPKIPLPG